MMANSITARKYKLRVIRTSVKQALTDPQQFFRLMRDVTRRYRELRNFTRKTRRGRVFTDILSSECLTYHDAHPYDKSVSVLMSLGGQYLNARRFLLRKLWRPSCDGVQLSLFDKEV